MVGLGAGLTPDRWGFDRVYDVVWETLDWHPFPEGEGECECECKGHKVLV